MDTVATLCVYLILYGVGHSIDLKPDLYAPGESATVHINQLQKNGKKILEINFSGYASKLHVTNVMLYDITKKHDNYISINRNYTGRITNIKMNHNGLSFWKRNVTFMDSGNYTIFEDSVEDGKTSILVARYRLTGQDKEPMVIPFMYNKVNISTIKIEMRILSITFPVLIYDVKKEHCTTFGQLYVARTQNCVLSGNRFSFTFREVSWLDKDLFPRRNEDELLLKQTVASTGSSTSYTLQSLSSSEKCQFKEDIGMDGVFKQMFKVEMERLSIKRERQKAELENMKVEKQRLAIETERLGLEIERTEILKSKSTY